VKGQIVIFANFGKVYIIALIFNIASQILEALDNEGLQSHCPNKSELKSL